MNNTHFADVATPFPHRLPEMTTLSVQLGSILRNEYQLLQDLENILQDEYSALSNQGENDLESIAARKIEVLRSLSDYEKQRRHVVRSLSRAGSSRGDIGEAMPFLAADEQPVILSLWHQLLDITRKIQALNRENGYLIEIKLKHVEGALGAISGQASGQRPYTANGQTNNTPNKHRIGEA